MKKLTHETFGELQQGAIGYAFDTAVREVMADCERRPGLKKPRTVTLKITFTPAANTLDMGQDKLDTIGIVAGVATSTPGRSGGVEYLNVSQGADANGEPEVSAVFAQDTLLDARRGN